MESRRMDERNDRERSAQRDVANTQQWTDPRNWRGGPLGLYVAARDSRLLVPRRSRLGLTINFGHPIGAIAVLVAIALLVVAHLR